MSFFYDGRLPVHLWGMCDCFYKPSAADGISSSWWIDDSRLGENRSSSQYQTPRSPIVPIAEDGPRKIVCRLKGGSAENAFVDEAPACEKQLPWKKLQFGYYTSDTFCIGLTIHGELYGWGRVFDDNQHLAATGRDGKRVGQSYISFRPRSSRSLLSGDARPHRIWFPDVPFAIKDFACCDGVITMVTKEGRVFVSGRLVDGAHGVPPSTERSDATLLHPGDNGRAEYASTVPPFFPVATEVLLPDGVVAEAVPSQSRNVVIGDDGQLYFWRWDGETMISPRKYTGFVKSIEVVNGGSGYRWENTSGLPGEGLFERGVSLTDPPNSPGNATASALVQVEGGVVTKVIVMNSGRGYTSPPQFNAADFAEKIGKYGGQGLEIRCTLFDDSCSFLPDGNVGNGLLLGASRELYVWSGWYETAGRWPLETSPTNIIYHSPGPYKFARGGVVISESGALYVVAYVTQEWLESHPGQYPALNPQGAIPSDNLNEFERLPLGDARWAYNVWVFCPIPGGDFVAGASGGRYQYLYTDGLYATSNDNSEFPRSEVHAVVAIKSDGSMWSAGSNQYGLLGDSENLMTYRGNVQRIAGDSTWVDVCYDPNGVFFAIRKDAVCRSLDQPMEYYDDDYYTKLQ